MAKVLSEKFSAKYGDQSQKGLLNGRAGEIRTRDLLHPKQARYQAALRPEHTTFR
jgi:hypothetical protein